jgi:hypothetical protein
METVPTRSPREIKASTPHAPQRGTALARIFGLLAAGIVILGIYVGSRGLRDFDTALVSYAAATVFAAFGVGYRYAIWLSRPPTMRYFRRGLELLFAPREPRAPRPLALGQHPRPALHPEALMAPLDRARLHVLGLHPGRGGDVPPVLRLDPLRDAP